jgi:hypothetical protein
MEEGEPEFPAHRKAPNTAAFCYEHLMALPPEPLSSVLPAARQVVVGVVVDVVDLGPWSAVTRGPPDSAPPCPAQRATVRVVRVLRGAPVDSIVVDKPAAPYALSVDVGGAFLLDTSTSPPTILGRYGPDTWGVDDVAAAIHDAATAPETT